MPDRKGSQLGAPSSLLASDYLLGVRPTESDPGNRNIRITPAALSNYVPALYARVTTAQARTLQTEADVFPNRLYYIESQSGVVYITHGLFDAATFSPVALRRNLDGTYTSGTYTLTDSTEVFEEGAPDSGNTFLTDWLVVNAPYGKYQIGQTVPDAGKTPVQSILNAFSGVLYPTYTVAALSIDMSASPTGEVGEVVINTIGDLFTPGDAGSLTNNRLFVDGQQVASGLGNTLSKALSMTRALTPKSIHGLVSYNEGDRKTTSTGEDDDRNAAIRNPNAPQAAEADFHSETLSFRGFYRLFWGAASVAPATSAQVRALPGNQLTSAGNQFTLTTGTTEKTFAIVLPPGLSLVSVTDLDNLNANITTAYVAQPTISVNNAGGIPVPGYTPYVYQAAGPYGSSARHLFQFA
ncbi:hypothetical protein LJY25_14815 [Hymenobacter sp. BT175]|uniref:hypothetical protein n=1 Tax=Hymenobacter translucens TaxID=2886507 RepID=UPI001D0F4611|nr:hypothetical protein [Hymenobacter translucens]MCC2547725.1 hypothetical protein [Hymenobacter translucens]